LPGTEEVREGDAVCTFGSNIIATMTLGEKAPAFVVVEGVVFEEGDHVFLIQPNKRSQSCGAQAFMRKQIYIHDRQCLKRMRGNVIPRARRI